MKKVMTERPTVTRFAREGQDSLINLAEAYAYRDPVPAERAVLSSLQAVYDASVGANVRSLEVRLVKDFLGLSCQAVPRSSEPFVLFSASEAILIVAKILAQRQMSCAVLEPTLDIVPSLITSAGVRMSAYSESLLRNPEEIPASVNTDALYMVLPNNPTGFWLDRPLFERVVRACQSANMTLIIDASFRAFEPRACFDYYEVLEAAGTDYLVIEDTGKLWATNGIKAGILVASEHYVVPARELSDDLVLNISPFTLMLLSRLASDAGAEAIADIRQLTQKNRGIVRQTLRGSHVFSVAEESMIPVDRIFYDKSVFPDQQRLLLDLRERGLTVVGSESLYWAGSEHKPFLRIALSRNSEYLRQGIEILRHLEDGTV